MGVARSDKEFKEYRAKIFNHLLKLSMQEIEHYAKYNGVSIRVKDTDTKTALAIRVADKVAVADLKAGLIQSEGIPYSEFRDALMHNLECMGKNGFRGLCDLYGYKIRGGNEESMRRSILRKILERRYSNGSYVEPNKKKVKIVIDAEVFSELEFTNLVLAISALSVDEVHFTEASELRQEG